MKTALVIGASRGIGHEFVCQLLKAGWNVYATARFASDIDKLKGLNAHAIELDVSSASSLAGLDWQLDGVKIDLAIYVAGFYGPNTGAKDIPSASDFDQVMHVNVLGAMQCIALIGSLVEDSGGKFVFVSSLMGSINQTQSSFGWIYRASKAALNMVVKSASHDYPKATFVAINPGWVQTQMGGSNAPTTVQESVSKMLAVIDQLSMSDSGSFQSYDGREMSW